MIIILIGLERVKYFNLIESQSCPEMSALESKIVTHLKSTECYTKIIVDKSTFVLSDTIMMSLFLGKINFFVVSARKSVLPRTTSNDSHEVLFSANFDK